MSNKILISFSEFATLMNVSKQAVSKAIQEKRLTPVIDPKDGKRKLNVEMATAEWRKKSDLRIENSKMSENSPGFAHGGSELGGDPEDDGISKESGGLYKAKTDSEKMKAKILELEYKEKIGTLVDAEQAKKEAYKLGRLTRDAILNVPAQICNELAVENDPFQVHLKLTQALTKALDELVTTTEKLNASEVTLDEDDDVEFEEEASEEDQEE